VRKINVELPNRWELHADGRLPYLIHPDRRRLEPKEFAAEGDAQGVYRALKLEEDRLGRIYTGAEHDNDWIVIWSARMVIGDFFNRKTSPFDADRILHEETEKAVRREQEERAKFWN
jgi:hypothetical protein